VAHFIAIPSLVETGLPDRLAARSAPRRFANPATPDSIVAALHNTDFGILFSSTKSKLHLPPDWIAIILHAAGVGPVGASQYK
jgi:hypothetical protein